MGVVSIMYALRFNQLTWSVDDWQALVDQHATVLLPRNVQRFRGGLLFKVHRLCVSLNSRLESNKEEQEVLRLDEPLDRYILDLVWHWRHLVLSGF